MHADSSSDSITPAPAVLKQSSSAVKKPARELGENPWFAYSAVITATALALGARWLLDPALGDHVPYSLMYAVVALSAIYLSVGPSILAAAAGLVGTLILFVEPRGSIRISGVPDFAEALTYVGVCVVIIVAGETNRRSKLRLRSAHEQLEAREEALRVSSEQLEKRVAERTSELKDAEESARQLGAQVLKMQDNERRRIARELHDSVGQLIALLNINMARLQASAPLSAEQREIVSDSKGLAENVIHEVRTISHLLHPPLLDEMGLPSALKWYVEGFSKRSGIETELELSAEFGRLPPESEIAIFRVVQEALTNVHRHSGSKSAAVRLFCSRDTVGLEVADSGKGIPAQKRAAFAAGGAMGVGLRGMRERIEQLGGAIELRSSTSGTTVVATLPAPASSAAAAGEDSLFRQSESR
ncbi:MAG TPA: ATP-binding protein [Candidatus Aquilonibacter sp.]|nr:ATP-binding protein [Candidatus Aquilonibacter sp.]